MTGWPLSLWARGALTRGLLCTWGCARGSEGSGGQHRVPAPQPSPGQARGSRVRPAVPCRGPVLASAAVLSSVPSLPVSLLTFHSCGPVTPALSPRAACRRPCCGHPHGGGLPPRGTLRPQRSGSLTAPPSAPLLPRPPCDAGPAPDGYPSGHFFPCVLTGVCPSAPKHGHRLQELLSAPQGAVTASAHGAAPASPL